MGDLGQVPGTWLRLQVPALGISPCDMVLWLGLLTHFFVEILKLEIVIRKSQEGNVNHCVNTKKLIARLNSIFLKQRFITLNNYNYLFYLS